MSEFNLLAFGCLVSFIAVAGTYVYCRAQFTLKPRAERHEDEEKPETGRPTHLRDVA